VSTGGPIGSKLAIALARSVAVGSRRRHLRLRKPRSQRRTVGVCGLGDRVALAFGLARGCMTFELSGLGLVRAFRVVAKYRTEQEICLVCATASTELKTFSPQRDCATDTGVRMRHAEVRCRLPSHRMCRMVLRPTERLMWTHQPSKV